MVVDTHSEVVLTGWKPSSEGWIILNIDGSCWENGNAGCGGIIKGSDGEWLDGFAKGIEKCCAYITEI